METVLSTALTTARSGRWSPLKSPCATAAGSTPVAKSARLKRDVCAEALSGKAAEPRLAHRSHINREVRSLKLGLELLMDTVSSPVGKTTLTIWKPSWAANPACPSSLPQLYNGMRQQMPRKCKNWRPRMSGLRVIGG